MYVHTHCSYTVAAVMHVFIGNEKYSHFIDSMWKDISAAQAACDSIDNTETVKILDVLENSEGILVSGMGKFPYKALSWWDS